MQKPNFQEIEELRKATEQNYIDSNKQGSIQPSIDIYLSFMEKNSQNSSFCILDDYSYYLSNGKKHGKLFLIKDVIDVITHKKLSKDYLKNIILINM